MAVLSFNPPQIVFRAVNLPHLEAGTVKFLDNRTAACVI